MRAGMTQFDPIKYGKNMPERAPRVVDTDTKPRGITVQRSGTRVCGTRPQKACVPAFRGGPTRRALAAPRVPHHKGRVRGSSPNPPGMQRAGPFRGRPTAPEQTNTISPALAAARLILIVSRLRISYDKLPATPPGAPRVRHAQPRPPRAQKPSRRSDDESPTSGSLASCSDGRGSCAAHHDVDGGRSSSLRPGR